MTNSPPESKSTKLSTLLTSEWTILVAYSIIFWSIYSSLIYYFHNRNIIFCFKCLGEPICLIEFFIALGLFLGIPIVFLLRKKNHIQYIPTPNTLIQATSSADDSATNEIHTTQKADTDLEHTGIELLSRTVKTKTKEVKKYGSKKNT